MAEQAQRRAPEAPSQQTSSNDNHALEELRHLIVAPERQGLAEIRDRIDNLERRAEDVSSVVAEAIQMRREQGDDQALTQALGPTIEATLRDSVRERPHVIADALFPVMGPAIRKSIAETLRTMLESFNEALEHSLSWQGIKWRIEAIQTGKPFAEIVLLHSLVYQIEEVFLIHRKSGIVLCNIAAPGIEPMDADMLSGLLSALQQFAQDALRANRDDWLDLFRVGERPTWVEMGPNALVAAVFRGNPPEDFRVRMRNVLEEIHQRYGAALERFDGDVAPFRATECTLAQLLEKRVRQGEQSGKKKPYAVMTVASLILMALLGWGSYVTYRVHQWSAFERTLQQESGIAITSFERDGGEYRIRGFRDPLAPEPAALARQAGVDASRAQFQLAPFYSLDDSFVARRANKLLDPPKTVKLSVKGGVLRAEGAARPDWIERIRDRGPWIPGVRELDLSSLKDAEVVALHRNVAEIEAVKLLFRVGRAELESGQQDELEKTKGTIAAMLGHASRSNQSVVVEVVGHTDTTGMEASNLPLSRQRADQVLQALEHMGIRNSALQPVGVGTSQPLRAEDSDEGRRLNRSVTFRVKVTPVVPAADEKPQ